MTKMKTIEDWLTHSFKTYGIAIPKELVREIRREAFEKSAETVDDLHREASPSTCDEESLMIVQCGMVKRAILSLANQVEEGK